MRICMLTQDYPPMTGGIASHVHELSKQLVKMGHEIYVITPKYENCTDDEVIDGIRIYRIPKVNVPKLRTYYYSFRDLNLINKLSLMKLQMLLNWFYLMKI